MQRNTADNKSKGDGKSVPLSVAVFYLKTITGLTPVNPGVESLT